MKHLKKFDSFNESYLAGSRSPLYHTTSIKNAVLIFKTDMLKASVGDEVDPSTKAAVSLSRYEKFRYMEGFVSFKLDQEKLMNKYKIKPYEFFRTDKPKSNPRRETNYEFEEQILKDVKPLSKYLMEIQLDARIIDLSTSFIKEWYLEFCEEILAYSSKHNIKITWFMDQFDKPQHEIPWKSKKLIQSKEIPLSFFEKELSVTEDRNQLEIFNKTKPEHVDILDAFETFSKKANFKGPFVSETNYQKYFDENIDAAVNELIKLNNTEIPSDYFTNFLEQNLPDERPLYYDRDWFKDNDQEFDRSIINYDFDFAQNNQKDLFSKKGLDAYNKFLGVSLKNAVDDFELREALQNVTKDGLSIYRSITYKTPTKSNTLYKDLYDLITKEYTGAGYYWTFDEEAPQSYGAENIGTEYIIYGKVRLSDINWINTILKNIYSLKEEKEIELKTDAIIKIVKILNKDKDAFINLEEPLFLKP